MTATTFAGHTDVGRRRSRNDDRWGADPAQGLYMVADGVGSTSHGDLAAALVVDMLPAYVARHLAGADLRDPQAIARLGGAVVEMCDDLYARSQTDSQLGSADTTLVAAVVGDSCALIAHLGDSRAYLYRDRRVQRLTSDHTIVQAVMDAGELSEEAAAHHPNRSVVTRHVLMTPPAKPDVSIRELQPGDRILLCSDGLHGVVDDATLAVILTENPDPTEACRVLIDAANQGGGPDNITVVLVNADHGPATAPAAAAATVPDRVVAPPSPAPPNPVPPPVGADLAATQRRSVERPSPSVPQTPPSVTPSAGTPPTGPPPPGSPPPGPPPGGPPPGPPTQQIGTPPRRVGVPPPEPWRPPRRRAAKWALIIAIVVILVAAAVAGYFLWSASQNQHPAAPSGQTAQSGAPSLLPGQPGQPGQSGQSGQSASPKQQALPFGGLKHPQGVAVDSSGNVYVVYANGSGGTVMRLAAGSSTPTALPFSELTSPYGVAVDSAGDVFVTDVHHGGRLAELQVGSVSAVDLLAGKIYSHRLLRPRGVAVDSAGIVYVANQGNEQRPASVERIPAGLDGLGVVTFSGLSEPMGVAVDAAGNVYVTDQKNNRVFKVAPGPSTPTELRFTGLKRPQGVAVDTAGNVFVADSGNQRVVKLAPGSDAPVVLQFSGLVNPTGVAVDAAGAVYVADDGSGQVVKLPAG
jgi:serine/threonine protein phosphatase PrpC/DNA-binding beta-propeller fold protein YncE